MSKRALPPDPADRTSMTLLQRLQAGSTDQDAWARVVHLYGERIRHWAGRRGVVGADADDVAQEVFQAAARGLEKFRRDRPEDTFRGWLFGITRNVLLRHLERGGRNFAAPGGTAALAGLNQLPEPDTDEDDSPAERTALYRRGLDLVRGEFEARTWSAFWQHVVEGRSPAEVALELGVSPAAIRQAKSRVLRRLREELGDLID